MVVSSLLELNESRTIDIRAANEDKSRITIGYVSSDGLIVTNIIQGSRKQLLQIADEIYRVFADEELKEAS